MDDEKDFINTQMPKELAQKIRIIAAQQNVSAGELIRRAVIEYLKDINVEVIIKNTGA